MFKKYSFNSLRAKGVYEGVKSLSVVAQEACCSDANMMMIWGDVDIDPYLYVSIHISSVSIHRIHFSPYPSADIRHRIGKYFFSREIFSVEKILITSTYV